MRYWSEGLGRRELVINLEKSKLTRKPAFLELSGVVDSPAPWAYEIEVEFDDWKAILETAVKRETGTFIVQRSTVRELFAIASGLAMFVAMLGFYRARHQFGLDRNPAPSEQTTDNNCPDTAGEKSG